MKNILFAIFILIVSPAVLLAEYISPELIKVRTEHYSPALKNLPYGVLTYEVSWQGIPVARATIDVRNEMISGFAVADINVKSNSFLDVFYRLRHESQGVFDARSFRPVKFSFKQKENSKEQYREVIFNEDGTLQAKDWKKGKTPVSVFFNPENQTLDPISAVFLARSLPVDIGSKMQFDVFNAKHRFLITFDVPKKEKIKVGEKEFEAYKLVPTVKKLTETKVDNKLRSAAIWVSTGPERLLLKLESEVFVGAVTAKLVQYESEKPGTYDTRQVRARLAEPNWKE